MKRFIYGMLFIVVVMAFIAPHRSVAAPGDTLVVYATPIDVTLDSVVNHDQATAHHHVYVLASTDTPYTFNASVVVNDNVTFLGVLGSGGRPPCIQPNVLQDGSIPGHLFTFTKSGSVVRIENLYLVGISVDNSVNWGDGQGITVTADSVKCHINNVVFEQWSQFGISYSGKWDSFWITNCKFRNFVTMASDYIGEAFRNRNDLGAFPTDTLVMKYNTFLALNCYVAAPVTTAALNYWDFEHNTIVGIYKNPFFAMNATNWICDHNIFYAAYAGGMANGEYPWWDRIWSPGVGAVIDLDTLSKPNAAAFGVDTTQATWSATAEAKRTIEVNDNIYFMPKSITDFVTAWDDTAHGLDSIYTCGWMNNITTNMFTNHTRWPGLHDVGNKVDVDPGYGPGIAAMIGAPGTTVPAGDGIGLLPYLTESRTHSDVTTHLWGYMQAAPDYSSGNWNPIWPLPEQSSGDLKYSAALTATDGKPYGDPYWFTLTPTGVKLLPVSVPSKFDLSNNYPNPFNPSTDIKVSLKQAGVMSLKVYNVLGELVKVVDQGYKPAGEYTYNVNMDNFASGVYFYTLQQGANFMTKKMILLK